MMAVFAVNVPVFLHGPILLHIAALISNTAFVFKNVDIRAPKQIKGSTFTNFPAL